ncbi:NAD(P)H-dependent glycerol-3-phosphate dehydrogenase [Merismopedia glauca CCAP 1448/3]|uniref:Glycerol-3-phosphate dehydrogenase [NAD(P)+] n=1 Tax=Merismopedia glauca CCAP 1448/3 TaxID=1296344 RepID=A0A2T1C2X1_9CYAN|nr:NAD(P)H-dependent glycerol-3-phosphate dehydrogenase [Merismopedia glauca CCAP 1448/3]
MFNSPIAILGAGAWGSALATLAERNDNQVKIWSRRSASLLEEVVVGCDMIVSAVSISGVSTVAKQLQTVLSPQTIIVTATKGLEPLTARTPAQIWQDFLPNNPVVVLSGPNLAKEIQQGLPGATVVASANHKAASTVQQAFSSAQFRVYTNEDPLGVELGGTLKNVMAIAAGACDGLQLGTNAKAGLLTRGLAEIIRVGQHWGAKPETFYGLSGLGDLLATCNSHLSRNYQVGYHMAQGKTLSEALAMIEGTAEGVNTTRVLIQRAEQQNISVPVSYQVYRLIQGEVTPEAATRELMSRDAKSE